MLPEILNIVQEKGHTVFKNKDYNVNIIGVRSLDRQSNSFDDKLHLVFKNNGIWVDLVFKITTDPGLYHLRNPSKIDGTAILKSGQYRSCYRLDLHRGKYKALCQREGKVRVYRDRNKDNILNLDENNVNEGYFGINIHRSNSKQESTQVNKWSAGCQVFSDPYDYDIFISILEKSAQVFSNKFTYTLIEK